MSYIRIHKKIKKQRIKNYQLLPLFLIRRKVSERLACDTMFSHLLENITLKISPFFTPGDSCINHVLVNKHESYSRFDKNYEEEFSPIYHKSLREVMARRNYSQITTKQDLRGLDKALNKRYQRQKTMVVLSGSVHLELISTLVSPQMFYSLSSTLSI